MPGNLTDEEHAFRKQMSAAYKSQEHAGGGYDDWGEFTAHVAHEYRQEIDRLRELLRQHKVAAGAWHDPVG